MTDRRTALDAFLEHKARIDLAVERLKAASDEHFSTHPDGVDWGDVGDLCRLADALEHAVDAHSGDAE